jgi:Protein of unknown function (DUF2865)
MGSRGVVATLLLPLAAASPAAEAQYFRPGPFGGAFRSAPSLGPGGVLPNAFSPYAYPGYRPDAGAGASSAIGTYRTLCVRLCDGFYFPISFATSEAGLARDAEQCRASCGVEARLFYHHNPGGSVETMMDLTGRAYSALATAFKYRKTLVAGCLCRPPPLSAAAGALGAEGGVGAASMPAAADGYGKAATGGAPEPGSPEGIDPLADPDAVPALERPVPIVRDLQQAPQGSASSRRQRPPSRSDAPNGQR